MQCQKVKTMINKDNIEQVILFNQQCIQMMNEKIHTLHALGDPLIFSKPLEFIKTYLYENSHVLEFPINNLEYGGLVFYHHQHFYIHINTAQPKVYENFMWAHEFYHYFFDQQLIKTKEENFVLVDSVLEEKERMPNLFASEFLINSFVLERKFCYLQKEYDHHIINIVMHLMSVFELPFKAIVVKLAQDGFIHIEDAKQIIDYSYKQSFPDQFDRTLLAPSNKIRIDRFDKLASLAMSQMNEQDYQSIVNQYQTLYQQVLQWRAVSHGDRDYDKS